MQTLDFFPGRPDDLGYSLVIMGRIVKRSKFDRRSVSDLSYFARGGDERRGYTERRSGSGPEAAQKSNPNLLDRAAWAGIVLLGIVATLLLLHILSQ